MSAIQITNIQVKNPKDYFQSEIDIVLDCEVFHELSREFEFRVVYIGSANNSDKDQILDLMRIQPMPVGNNSL